MSNELDAIFEKAVSDGTICGCVLLATNKDETFKVEKAYGRKYLNADSVQIRKDDIFSLISVSKILTSVAAMQLLEEQKIQLDDDVSPLVPELASQKILKGFSEDGTPVLVDRQKPLLFRYLLTHSIGTPYYSPDLARYWKFTNFNLLEHPTVHPRYSNPLTFEPGEGFDYGSATDWVGKVIEKVSGQTLDHYVKANILEKLNIDDITFRIDHHPEFNDRIPDVAMRSEDGAITANTMPHIGKGLAESFGGQGAYANLQSLLKIMRSLLANDEVLLRKETVDMMFTPQLTQASKAALNQQMKQSGIVSIFADNKKSYDWNFIGRQVEDCDSKNDQKRGRTTWFGYMNSYWFIDFEAGLCGIFGTQILPMGDSRVGKLISSWESIIYTASRASQP